MLWCGWELCKKKVHHYSSVMQFFSFNWKFPERSLAIIYSIRGSFLSVFQPAHIQIEFSTFTGWSSKEKIESQKTHKFQSEIYMEIHKKKLVNVLHLRSAWIYHVKLMQSRIYQKVIWKAPVYVWKMFQNFVMLRPSDGKCVRFHKWWYPQQRLKFLLHHNYVPLGASLESLSGEQFHSLAEW